MEHRYVITDLTPALLSTKTSVDRTSVMNDINVMCIT